MMEQCARRQLVALMLGLACGAALWTAPAHAAGQAMVCMDATGAPWPVSPTNPCPVTTTPGAATWQATMTLTAATSTTLVDANVTKAPNSAATPASFGTLTVINSGADAVYVCQFGGTCSATAGGGYIASGACDTYNISPASVPTLYSTSGTALSLRNGPGC